MWCDFGVKNQQIAFRLGEASRMALDEAASQRQIGLSTLVGSIIDAWVKAERRRQCGRTWPA